MRTPYESKTGIKQCRRTEAVIESRCRPRLGNPVTTERPSRFSLVWQDKGWLGLIFIVAGILCSSGSVAIAAYFEHRKASAAVITDMVFGLLQPEWT